MGGTTAVIQLTVAPLKEGAPVTIETTPPPTQTKRESRPPREVEPTKAALPRTSAVSVPEPQATIGAPEIRSRTSRPHQDRNADTPPSEEVQRREEKTPVRRTQTSNQIHVSTSIPAVVGSKYEPPRISGRQPAYPAEARRLGLRGRVVVRLFIDVTGAITRVELATSSGHRLLDEAALSSLRTWRAQPARRGGVPVATVELQPVDFQLR